MKVVKNYLIKLIPYFIILAMTCFACYLLFYNGYAGGDDGSFHFPNINELYHSFKNGDGYTYISTEITSGFGSGTRLFYSPLPHLCVAFLGVIYSWFGLTLLQAFKFIVFISVFISGIIVYRFSLKITKKSIVFSVILSSIFILYPYRLFDFFARLAFAEALAILFIPLFFFGLYDLVHDDEYHVSTFIKIIFGAGLLFLCHNITALYTYLFGFLYLLLNITKIIPKFKDKQFSISIGVALFLTLGVASLSLFSTLELLGDEFYNVSDNEIMWTTVNHLQNRAHQGYDFSGFLNIGWMSSYLNTEETRLNALFMQTVIFLSSSVLYFIILLNIKPLANKLSKSNKKVFRLIKYEVIVTLISLIFILISILLLERLEAIFASIILALITTFVFIRKEDIKPDNKNILTDINFWFSVISIVIIIFMINNEWIWSVVPEFMRNIQFPWRLWGIFQFVIIIFIASIYRHYSKNKIYVLSSGVFASLLMLFSQSLVEKRIKAFEQKSFSVYSEISDDLKTQGENGWNKEYFPRKLTDSSYKSEYDNSIQPLFYKFYGSKNSGFSIYSGYVNSKNVSTYGGDVWADVSTTSDTGFSYYTMQPYIEGGYTVYVTNKDDGRVYYGEYTNHNGYVSVHVEKGNYIVFTVYNPYSIKPVYLEGSGDVELINNYNKLKINANEKSLIQVPLIYYPGYSIKAYQNGSEKELEVKEIDGFVSFEVDSGEYEIEIEYVGTTIKRFSRLYFVVSIEGAIIFYFYGKMIEDKRRRLKGIVW